MAAQGSRLVERPTVRILGTHGVPANYGGFETAAENVALFLRDSGWRVIIYCQEYGAGPVRNDVWKGLERVIIPVARSGWLGTTSFDLTSIRHASRYRDVCLTFGYNTAILNTLQWVRGIPNIINMDGIEWSRSRWGPIRQAILWSNERVACWIGSNLIADHPSIERYLSGRADPQKITMIAYGANAVTEARTEAVTSRGLEPGGYLTLICRPIPENSILELVKGFAALQSQYRLAILGTYTPESDQYHRAVMDAAGSSVSFLGSVYDPAEVAALRFHSAVYLHGHTVGGTNPSLVEAMAAGNPILAHDNEYNRWVAEDGAVYFKDGADVASLLAELLQNPDQRAAMSRAARQRHLEQFTWERVAGEYDTLLSRYLPEAMFAGEKPDRSTPDGEGSIG